MRLEILSAPESEWVSLADAKAQARITSSAEDSLITLYISAARKYAENKTGLSLAPYQYRLVLDSRPSSAVRLLRGPVSSIDSVKITDNAGTVTTLTSTQYHWSGDKFKFSDDFVWPTNLPPLGAVEIDYTAGYAEADLPDDLKIAMMSSVEHLHAHRGRIVLGTIATNLPKTVDDVLEGHRVMRL